MSRKLYDNQGKWVALDNRHEVRREWVGQSKPQWVFRFCDEYVSHHTTKQDAISAALKWEMGRVVLHTCDTARDADHYVEACERMDRAEDRHRENPEASYWENF